MSTTDYTTNEALLKQARDHVTFVAPSITDANVLHLLTLAWLDGYRAGHKAATDHAVEVLKRS